MKFGERQVETELSKIRRDHVARYEFVADKIGKDNFVIDFACGVGYGSNVIASAGNRVIGVDIDEEALEFAEQHWKHSLVQFANGDASKLSGDSIGEFDVAVSFETIEHIEDPLPLLKSLRASSPRLFASVPNESVMPWRRADGATTAFHFRHYTKAEFEDLLNRAGWKVEKWYGQLGPESEVEEGVEGRTLIAECVHGKVKRPVPDHVVILGLGPSLDEYTNIVKRIGNRKWFADEVWGINMLGDIFQCDYIFHMDDVRIQEIRAKAMPQGNIAAMVDWMRKTKTPIITSRPHPDYPSTVAFPLEDVVNNLKHIYFNSTAAYAVAYAIAIGVKKISMFGLDYTYPNAHDAEKGRACVEFWLGVAIQRGIELAIPTKSSLMDSIHSQQERFYGYDTVNVETSFEDERMKIEFSAVEKMPTADEIEKRYCHEKHPNALVQEKPCA